MMSLRLNDEVHAAGANDPFDPDERLLQNMLVQKEDRGQSLVLRGSRHMLLDGQVIQDRLTSLSASSLRCWFRWNWMYRRTQWT